LKQSKIIEKNMVFEIGETVSIGKKDKLKQGKIVEIVLTPEIKAYEKYYVININGENLCYLKKELYKL